MNNNLNSTLAEQACSNNAPKRVKAKEIFLGIDAHLRSNQVARKIDNSAIGPVQNLGFEELLLFAHKQLSLAERVYAVYEAGPLGYVMYRRLRELGIEAYVSAPECLEQGKRKFNKLDGRKLCSRLYSYVQGDRQMMRVVRVPTEQEEALRAHSRQYDQLVKQRKAISAQGRSLTLSQGFSSMSHGWWRAKSYQQCPSATQRFWRSDHGTNGSGNRRLGAALAIDGRWPAFSVLSLESIPLERLNAWARSPRWVRLGCEPKVLNWFGG